MEDHALTVEEACRQPAAARRLLLAVSGGRDSMVLLHAVEAASRQMIAAVATFDHGTGASARRAAALVVREARALGVPVRRGRARASDRRPTEAAWRDARWEFLRATASEFDAAVATGHTRDDQVETVILRALRGSGARGLAGLYAPSPVIRPLLECGGREIAAYAAEHGVRWVEDPSNASRRHLRNRVRLDLRPALERAQPGFSAAMLTLAREAASLRARVDALVSELTPESLDGRGAQVARAALLHYDAMGLALLWPALAARIGVALDRRGAARLAELTLRGRAGSRVPLSGGFEAVLHRDVILLRRVPRAASARTVRLVGGPRVLGAWRFRPAAGAGEPDSLWSAALAARTALTARAWRAGDRMTPLGAGEPRRVKGLLRDAGIDAARRAGWPVVLAGDEIVWIPGVRRSFAATARSGRPVVHYRCEPLDDR